MKKIHEIEQATLYIEDEYIKVLSPKMRKYFNKQGQELQGKEIFKENKIFAFEKDGKWGFADEKGQIIVDAKYDLVTELNEYGFAGIKLKEKWGVVDEEGKIIVEPSYKIEVQEPKFINKYCQMNAGYGFEYYTDELEEK